MLSNTVRYVADQIGFEVIANWRLPNLSYTRRLQGLFKHFGITSVIDVGANAGGFRDQLRNELGFPGPIYSFEPDPTLGAALAQRAALDPKWTVFPMALGASTGTMTFNIMKNSVYNSFLPPTAMQPGVFGHGNVVIRTVDVEMRTLAEMASAFPDLKHTYFKVDTQGFDLEVLKGGPDVLCQVPALQTEVSLKPQYLGGPTMKESLAAFTELGFAIADLFLVSTDNDHRALEFDCIMVRDLPDTASSG